MSPAPLNASPWTLPLDLADIGRSGTHRIRDLWRQQDLGQIDAQFHAEVPAHGVILIRCTPITQP